MDCSLPGSSTHGIFRARVLEWVAVAFSESKVETKHIPRFSVWGPDHSVPPLLPARPGIQGWAWGLCVEASPLFSPNIALCIVPLYEGSPGATAAWDCLHPASLLPSISHVTKDSPVSQLTLELNLLRSTVFLHSLGVSYQYRTSWYGGLSQLHLNVLAFLALFSNLTACISSQTLVPCPIKWVCWSP